MVEFDIDMFDANSKKAVITRNMQNITKLF